MTTPADFEQARQSFVAGLEAQMQGRFEAARAHYEASLARLPDRPSTLTNLSFVLLRLQQHAAAQACARRALAVEPGNAEALLNLGLIEKDQGRPQAAIGYFEQALACQPDYPEARWNLALTQLLCGQFAPGWQGYESRWQLAQAATYRHPDLPAVRDLDQVRGRTVLVWAEQGLGDTLQFARYVPLLMERGARVVFEVQAPLLPVLAERPGLQVVARSSAVGADLQLPLLSLPGLLGTTAETIPPPHAPMLLPERAQAWAARLGSREGQLHIGVASSGFAGHDHDHLRSMPLELLAPLLPHGRLFLVQRELRERDRPWLQAHPEVTFLGEELQDFGDTAAVLAHMDVVISVDTSLVHLAGSMGKPLKVLLARDPDWRWLLDRTDSPWYPSARLYRQGASGGWAAVVEDLVTDLSRRD
ncbi:MAG: tetratricopeptide repeat protein [Curvibacter sp.]|jgi:hypothetical protein|nr:tetratricopeptide repeat protein [Curvibacter sp.]